MPSKISLAIKAALVCALAVTVVGKQNPPRFKAQFPIPLTSEYFPSGWMGDGAKGEKHLTVTKISVEINGESKIATKIVYHPGAKKWAGMYWQHPDGNWGQSPGLDLRGAREITFLARGETGSEVVEFLSGGIGGDHPDRFKKSLGDTALSTTWKPYRIDLRNLDLGNVVGVFAWSAAAPPENGDLVFYLADMQIK